jgi:hypothetical protein
MNLLEVINIKYKNREFMFIIILLLVYNYTFYNFIR